jgi:hypothetical protein
VFHSSTRIDQILQERDITWPPGSFLAYHAWAHFATWNDFSLHTFGALCGLLATAFLIRSGQRLHSWQAGLLAGLAFATSSYANYFMLEVRGYTIMLMLIAAYLWFYLRWDSRPSLTRSILLLVVQIAMCYIQFILVAVIALGAMPIGLRFLRYPRTEIGRVVRWAILALLTAITFLPVLNQFRQGLGLRSALAGHTLPSYFTGDLASYFRAFSNHADLLFGVILIIAIIGTMLSLRQINWRYWLWLLVWGIGVPTVAYLTRYTSALYTTRYLSFTTPIAYLLIGIGLATLFVYLRTRQPIQNIYMAAIIIVLAALGLTTWHPYDHRPGPTDDGAPLQLFVRAMAQKMQTGDTLLIDPNFKQFGGFPAEYYQTLYFSPGGIPLADTTHLGRRVWYLTRQGSEDATTLKLVEQGRLRTPEFWGPWYFIATLYEAPPQPVGNHFGNGLQFHGVDVGRRSILHAGDTLDLRLWWSVDKPIPPELSMSVQLLDPAGNIIAQQDGLPADAPQSLDQWQPNTFYIDHRTLTVPYHVQRGQYTLQLIVYHWRDGSRVSPEHDATPTQALILDRMQLDSAAEW